VQHGALACLSLRDWSPGKAAFRTFGSASSAGNCGLRAGETQNLPIIYIALHERMPSDESAGLPLVFVFPTPQRAESGSRLSQFSAGNLAWRKILNSGDEQSGAVVIGLFRLKEPTRRQSCRQILKRSTPSAADSMSPSLERCSNSLDIARVDADQAMRRERGVALPRINAKSQSNSGTDHAAERHAANRGAQII
jgi:hypothetical protein